MLSRLICESNENPCMKMTVFIKTMKIHYVLKGINGETHTGSTKKRSRQQKAGIGRYSFCLHFTDTFCKMYEIPAARVIRRGPPGSTLIIPKEIIGHNNNNNNNNNNHLTRGPPRFLPTRGSCRRGVLPPLRGGNSWTKESPVLPIPSYPALCREDTTSWNDGRPSTPNMRSSCRGSP